MAKETLTIKKIDSVAEKKSIESLSKFLMESTVKATRKKQNPYIAESADGLNQAFGKTKAEALKNLEEAIERRKQHGN